MDDKEQIREIIRDAVRETLISLGVDIEDPIALQKDFAHLRTWRESTDSFKTHSVKAALFTLVSGAIGLIILWFREDIFHIK